MLTLTRQGLLLSLSATVIPSQGSSDVPVSVTGDQSTYVGYTIEPRVGYYLNGIYKSIVCVYDSDAKTFDMPAEVFKQNGVIDITLALIDNTNANHIETCQAVHATVNKAPLGTVVLPDQTTWQDYVNSYMNQLFDSNYKEYTNEFLQKFFALQRTGRVYTVRFPLFSKSTSPIGEKMDYNEGLTCEPSTDIIIGQDDYQDIPLFKTYDVNAYVDNNGRIHITAFKGDKYFKDTGKVDVFVLGMSYYEKYWEDDNYWYYSRTDMPRDGYTLCAECRNVNGSESSYALYSKYISGEIDGKPYSSKGLIPKRNMSYNTCESYYHSRGKNYGGSPMYLYKYLMTTFYLKYATLNTQSKIYGCFNYSYQYAASMAESDVKRIILTTAQATNIVVGSYVSIGDKGSNSSIDRSNSYMHNKAEEVEVISKTIVDDSHVAINVDSPTSFNTTTTTYLSTMHWKSGFSDNVLGRDGSIGDLTSGKYPMVLQGIELAVGGYEVAGNAFMDIVSSTGKRDIYVTNDNSKIVTSVVNAKATYNKSKNSTQPTTLSIWNYITKMALDEENGMFNVIEGGNSGSGGPGRPQWLADRHR